MGKEPLGLYIFRFVMGALLLFFMGMLYWSSALLEGDLQEVKGELKQVKQEVSEMSARMEQGQKKLLKTLSTSAPSVGKRHAPEPSLKTLVNKRPHIDPSLPNLLEPDLFYDQTLPALLGPDFVPHGTLTTNTLGKPESLHPFINRHTITQMYVRCLPRVGKAKFGIYETLSPDLAIKMEKRSREDGKGVEFWVHLREGAFWQPLEKRFFPKKMELASWFLKKHPVTAHDFKFFYDAVMNPFNQMSLALAARSEIEDIEEFEVLDDLTFIVRWKGKEIEEPNGEKVWKSKYIAKQLSASLQPLPTFVYQYFADGSKIIDEEGPETYRTNSVWAQNFAEHWAKNVIVGCGPWKFDGMTEREIRFKRNDDYYFPLIALMDEEIIEIKESVQAVWLGFKTNHYPMYGLIPEQLLEYEQFLKSDEYAKQKAKGEEIHSLDYYLRTFSWIGWNQAKPLFKSKKVRRAMTMAIDRQRIIDQIRNGMGVLVTGSFFIYSPAYDASIVPWPFDPEQAKQLLAEEGWYDSDGDGILDKEIAGERVPFSFSLTYYVKNPIMRATCEYIAGALKDIGVQCRLSGLDAADFSAAFDGKTFDALALAWISTSPPPNPKQIWHSSFAKLKGSSNITGFANAEADQIIEALQYEDNPEKRIKLYHRFHGIMHEEQPYTFLYTPRTTLLYRERLKNVFIPYDRQDLIPGANVESPISRAFYLRRP